MFDELYEILWVFSGVAIGNVIGHGIIFGVFWVMVELGLIQWSDIFF